MTMHITSSIQSEQKFKPLHWNSCVETSERSGLGPTLARPWQCLNSQGHKLTLHRMNQFKSAPKYKTTRWPWNKW